MPFDLQQDPKQHAQKGGWSGMLRNVVFLGGGLLCFGSSYPHAWGIPLTPKTQTQVRSSTWSGEMAQKPVENLLLPFADLNPTVRDEDASPNQKASLKTTTLIRKEISIAHDHPTVTSSPFGAALLFHTALRGTRSFGDPWFSDPSGSPAEYRSAEWLGGFSLIPYVPEGIPPATLRIDATGRANFFAPESIAGVEEGPSPEDEMPDSRRQSPALKDPRDQARHAVIRTQIRMHLGLRDLNLSSQKSQDHKEIRAFSLALPDGLIVAEITAWTRRRIIKPEATLGYRMISRQGLEVDVLLPKHLIFAYRSSISRPRFYIAGQKKNHYSVPVIAELMDISDSQNDLELREKIDKKPNHQSFSLEQEERTQFHVGIQQKIFHIWHLSFEVGIAKTQWTLYRSSGQEHTKQTTGFGPYGALSLESLVPSFVDRGRS